MGSEYDISQGTLPKWPNDATHNRIIGNWYIYQRKGGHRTSTDDLITAWYAVHRCGQRPIRYLDLGCGVGSVLFMVCHSLGPTVALGVEIQSQSVMMAQRAIDELPDHDCDLRVVEADIRDTHHLYSSFDLVTGSPPYFPIGAGVLPLDAQRRACRFETRGGIEAYMDAASHALGQQGQFYIVHQTRYVKRVMSAGAIVGLHCTGQADFFMRSDHVEPFLSVFEFSRSETTHRHYCQVSVRDSDGKITDAYHNIRRELGVEV